MTTLEAPARSATLPRAAAGYRILRAWQRALDVAAHAHRLAHAMPASEQNTLAADLRRAGAAVPTHVAAGNLAYDRGEYRRALLAAQTALARVETLALLAERLALVPSTDVAALLATSADTLRLVRALARAVDSVRDASTVEPPVSEPTSTAPVLRPPTARPPARARRPRDDGSRVRRTARPAEPTA